jgi:tetratricopeptide (TPR) repeat protein
MKNFYFSGFSEDESGMDQARGQNAVQVRRAAEFRENFSKLADGDKPSLEALRKFCFEEHRLEDFQSAELMRIFTAFRSLRSFEDMMRIFEESKNEVFTGSQIVQEFYTVACNHTGRYQKAIEVATLLLREGDPNGEVYGTLGKAWYKKHEIAKNFLKVSKDYKAAPEDYDAAVKLYRENFPDDSELSNVEAHANLCLEWSKNDYEGGFLVAFESYPGINAVYSCLDVGDFEEARHMARLVHLACLRDGARETMDVLCASTMMQAACIMGASKAEIDATTEKFLSLDVKKGRLERTVQSLERLKSYLAEHEGDTKPFDHALQKIKGVLKHHELSTFNFVAKRRKKQTVTSAIHDVSSSYRGLASNFLGGHFVPGNFMFGGQLPDHYLTRTDWQQFQKLLEAPLEKLIGGEEAGKYPPTLKDVQRPEDFLEIADKIIRRAFGTDEWKLEDMMSEGHASYDETVNALLNLSGTKDEKTMDSRTNISVIMGLGLGDCRQHAQAKQILFDAWQKNFMNWWLGEAYTALTVDKDMKYYRQCIEGFKSIESVELRTIDAVVQAPVQMKEKYIKKLTGDGQTMAEQGGAMNAVENHTLTVLLKHNKKGELESLRFADSFYQNQYQWGDGEIPLDKLSFDENGKVILPAKTLTAVDPGTGQEVSVPVQLVPSRYTGKRDEVSRDEHGQLLLLGLPVEEGFSLADKLMQSHQQRTLVLEAVRRWYVKAGNVPDVLKIRKDINKPDPG